MPTNAPTRKHPCLCCLILAFCCALLSFLPLLLQDGGKLLFPKAQNLRLLEDRQYYMASLGVLSRYHREAAVALLKQDMEVE